jgi:hypothetical protein
VASHGGGITPGPIGKFLKDLENDIPSGIQRQWHERRNETIDGLQQLSNQERDLLKTGDLAAIRQRVDLEIAQSSPGTVAHVVVWVR